MAEETGLPVERRASRASRQEEEDEEVLAEFGYKQELKRDWGLMHNFGISFSIIVWLTSSASPLSLLGILLMNWLSHSQLLPVSRHSSTMASILEDREVCSQRMYNWDAG
jgi:hypothetical protein